MAILEGNSIPAAHSSGSWAGNFPDRLCDWSTRAIAASVAEFAACTLPATHVFVSQLIASGPAFRLRAAVGFENQETTPACNVITADQAETVSLLSKGLCRVDASNSVLADRISAMLGGARISAGASVPIRYGGGTWGVFGAYSDHARRFDEPKIRLLKKVSKHFERMLRQVGSVEANIITAKQDWEATVDALSQLVFVLGRGGRVIRTNRAVEVWGYGKVESAKGQHVCNVLKRITGCTDRLESLCWMDIEERLVVERLLEWEVCQASGGRTFRLSLRAIPGELKRQGGDAACFAVLVIDDVTGLKAECDAEKQLHQLSCKLIDAQEMERKKIAAELHDGIGQIMSAVKFQIEALMGTGTYPVQASYYRQLNSIVQNVQYAMEEVRKITQDLRPSTLDDLGLLLTIDWFCREFCAMHTGIRIDKEMSVEESAIGEQRKLVIYRVMQEAMNNVAKYADATAIRLELCNRDDGLYFRIRDNGQGFDVARVPPARCFRGFGLSSMRERVETTGGVFGIESSPGAGTTVQVYWPNCTAAENSPAD